MEIIQNEWLLCDVGSNISVIKEVESVFDPAFFSLGRFTIASLVFLPFLGNALDDKRLFNAAFELGLWASTGYLTQAFGLLTTDAGRASFISTFTVSLSIHPVFFFFSCCWGFVDSLIFKLLCTVLFCLVDVHFSRLRFHSFALLRFKIRAKVSFCEDSPQTKSSFCTSWHGCKCCLYRFCSLQCCS
jgi:hypothetical protein